MMNYYFHWRGKLNQSYILETPERQAIFEAVCDHFGIFTQCRYTFVNHLTDKSQEHKISHTVTQSYGRGDGSITFSTITSSKFKVDGVDIWEIIKKLGLTFIPKREKLKINFDVFRDGCQIAYLEAAGTNILKDGAHSKLAEKLPGRGLFKVSCDEADVEAIFILCFCLSRVEYLPSNSSD